MEKTCGSDYRNCEQFLKYETMMDLVLQVYHWKKRIHHLDDVVIHLWLTFENNWKRLIQIFDDFPNIASF